MLNETHLNDEWFENELDIIKLPIPPWLYQVVKNSKTPTDEQIQTYLAHLRHTLELPYLSVARIESALPTIIARYTNGHAHIAGYYSDTCPKCSCLVLQQSQ